MNPSTLSLHGFIKSFSRQLILSALAFSSTVAIAQDAQERMPGFDILIADLSQTSDGLKLGQIEDVTKRPDAYDNQPQFLPSGNMMLYTRVYQGSDGEQTESHIYNLVTKDSFRLTNTEASEYSPTLMPSQTKFSVIKAFDDKQKLWQYPLTSLDGEPVELLKDINPVGYHAWVNEKEVLLFVLGEPHRLELANIETGKSKVIDQDIGASLYKIPGSELMSYSVNKGSADSPQWQVNSFDVAANRKSKIATLPTGAYYYGWSGDGHLLAAQKSKIYSLNPNTDNQWQLVADITQECEKGVSRLTTNPQSSKIAMVCAR